MHSLDVCHGWQFKIFGWLFRKKIYYNNDFLVAQEAQHSMKFKSIWRMPWDLLSVVSHHHLHAVWHEGIELYTTTYSESCWSLTIWIMLIANHLNRTNPPMPHGMMVVQRKILVALLACQTTLPPGPKAKLVFCFIFPKEIFQWIFTTIWI